MANGASVIFLLTGTFFIFISGIGLLKMPNLLCRAHALTKALTLGIMLILIGMIFHFYDVVLTVKLGIAILFQLLTIPLSGHLLALLAYRHENAAIKQGDVPDARKMHRD
ncbi:MAG: monovalent cation/H(+) antiporter subunit G [Chlamydiales bacterium]|nr:monovalent cation/H(+) antiporter subunit G [Chlamydiia bacterium]MCP5508706.1 monovalent cation/H(+) antiporter subunit G [Chlamydiales bacterium]